MPSSIGNVCLDCARPWQLAAFWSQALGLPVHPDSEPDDDEVGIPFGDHELLFLRVPEPKAVKNRMHLCLNPDESRDLEVERLIGLGTSLVNDLRRPDGGWAVLADPEGNEFLRAAQRR